MTSTADHPRLLVISHVGDRSGAPILLLRFLDWMAEHTTLEPEVALLHGGSMEEEFARYEARVLGGSESQLWMVQRGLANLGYHKPAAALAWARHGPLMWSNRNVPIVLLNSVGSLPVVRFLPTRSPAKLVLYIHELDHSFERTIGTTAWDLLSPRIDHFVTCGARVTEMLIERRAIPASKVTEHPGFVDPPQVDPTHARTRRRELNIPESALVVGASGQPDWRKAPEVFVRVARALADRRPDLDPHFVWMGGEADVSGAWKLAHDVEAAGLSDRFHHVPETTEPAQVMATFDIFALTSREDPYPLVVLEAASLGIPVVAFDNGGVSQFAHSDDGRRAEIVAYLDGDAMADAIAGLADDATRREAMVSRARTFVLGNQLTSQAAPRLYDTLVAVAPALANARRDRSDRSDRLDRGEDHGEDCGEGHAAAEGSVRVILVDHDDREVGTAPKLAAHQSPGQLHRALSAFVIDGEGRIVLQRRSDAKHSFPGLWSNSCCTHPAPGETIVEAAERRVIEELRTTCRFHEVGVFTYRAEDESSGLVEHEVDHVLVGRSSDPLDPNPDEVSEVAAVHLTELREQIRSDPQRFTPWLESALAVLEAGAPATTFVPRSPISEVEA